MILVAGVCIACLRRQRFEADDYFNQEADDCTPSLRTDLVK